MSVSPSPRIPPPTVNKNPSDTVAGCRTRAAADLAAAAGMNIANQKLRFEHSAASWMLRADLIQRLNDTFEARRAAEAALWLAEEPPLPERRESYDEEPQHVRL